MGRMSQSACVQQLARVGRACLAFVLCFVLATSYLLAGVANVAVAQADEIISATSADSSSNTLQTATADNEQDVDGQTANQQSADGETTGEGTTGEVTADEKTVDESGPDDGIESSDEESLNGGGEAASAVEPMTSLATTEAAALQSLTVEDLIFFFKKFDEGSTESFQWLEYRPTGDDKQIPRIEKSKDSVDLKADIVWSDKSQQSSSEAGVALVWEITKTVDPNGNATDATLATVDQNGVVTATGNGNGKVTITCTAPSFAEFAGQKIEVEISGNGVNPALSIERLDFFFKKGGNSVSYNPNTGDIPKIETRNGTVELDADIVWSDGSKQSAAAAGINLSWKIQKTVDSAGKVIGDTLISVDSEGVVTATGKGNGTVTLVCTSPSRPAFSGSTIEVRISANEKETEATIPIGLSFRYTDAKHSSATAYNPSSGSIPEIISEQGSVSLLPRVTWSDGTQTYAAFSGVDVTWKIVSTTDLDGQAVDKALALVSSSGTVKATGLGDGIVTLSCSIDGYPAVKAQTIEVHIRGNSGEAYVTKVEVTNKDGVAYGDNTVNVEIGKLYNFYATVTYSDGTQKKTWAGDVIENLEWSVSDTEFSTIDGPTGMFVASKGFEKTRVIATVKNGDFYGRDIYGYVWANSPSDDPEASNPQNSLTIRVIYANDYEANGRNATIQEEKVFTLAQIESMAAIPKYYSWYTYSKYNDDKGVTKYGTQAVYGFTVESLLNQVTPTSELQYFWFDAADSLQSTAYTPSFFNADRYRYSFFQPSATDARQVGASGQERVEPMLAIRTSGNANANNPDYEALVDGTRFRLCLGLRSKYDTNTNVSISYINTITIVVTPPAEQPPDEEKEKEKDDTKQGNPGVSDGLGGLGDGGGPGGGSGGLFGAATSGYGGGSGGDGTSDSGTGSEAGGNPRSTSDDGILRSIFEVMSDSETPVFKEEDNPFAPYVIPFIGIAVVTGGLKTGVFFTRQRPKNGHLKPG